MMEVWVKVGESDATALVVVHAVPQIDHLKAAIKLELSNRFSTVDEDEIIIRDLISGDEIPSPEFLNLNSTNETVRVLGSGRNPFIVDAPPRGILTLTCYLSMNYLLTCCALNSMSLRLRFSAPINHQFYLAFSNHTMMSVYAYPLFCTCCY